jgi:hypothetical protein
VLPIASPSLLTTLLILLISLGATRVLGQRLTR